MSCAKNMAGVIVAATVQRAGRRQRITFAPRLYVTDATAAQRTAIAGLGIALLPEVLCLAELRAKRLVRVLPGHGVFLRYRAQRSLTAAVRTCIEHFSSELPGFDPGAARRS
ncbi:MAG: LysR substrate-binding domain-containing protein [Kofleriaceae bacterium]